MKLVPISKAAHLTSFWYRGPVELGNGPLCYVFVKIKHVLLWKFVPTKGPLKSGHMGRVEDFFRIWSERIIFWSYKRTTVIWLILACEQALLFGRVKRVSRVLARLTPLAQIGELARRLDSYQWHGCNVGFHCNNSATESLCVTTSHRRPRHNCRTPKFSQWKCYCWNWLKRLPPVSSHILLAFWMATYGRFDCILYFS